MDFLRHFFDARNAVSPGIRAEARASRRTEQEIPGHLECIADESGITAFNASIVDMSEGGIGLLVYSQEITLARGTVLRGCRIRIPGHDDVVVDLEVRHSEIIATAEGRRAVRSGCRLVDPTPEVRALARFFAG